MEIMKPLQERRLPTAKVKGVNWKWTTLYEIKELPGRLDGKPNEYLADRWTPNSPADREFTLYLPERKLSWQTVNGVAWGLEEIVMFDKKHSQDFFDLLIVRKRLLDPRLAILAIEGIYR